MSVSISEADNAALSDCCCFPSETYSHKNFNGKTENMKSFNKKAETEKWKDNVKIQDKISTTSSVKFVEQVIWLNSHRASATKSIQSKIDTDDFQKEKKTMKLLC